MSRACATCDSTNQHEPTTLIPIIGMVCDQCRVVLTRPTLLAGCIAGHPIASLCDLTMAEFESRRTRLRNQARDVCVEARTKGIKSE